LLSRGGCGNCRFAGISHILPWGLLRYLGAIEITGWTPPDEPAACWILAGLVCGMLLRGHSLGDDLRISSFQLGM
jgi:hypothetical protein